MREAGIAHMVLYGNAWQGDYLRYGADFGILEGHGIALIDADGAVELFLDSATEAERAEVEAPGVTRAFCRRYRARGRRTARPRRQCIGSPPRRAAFCRTGSPTRRATSQLEDATALVDKLLMHQDRRRDRRRCGARRKLADDAYGEFLQAWCGRAAANIEIVADIEAHLRRRGCPDNFMIIGSGGKDVFGMTPPSERRIAAGDLVTTELTPAVEGYFAQICRTLVVGKANEAQRRAFGVFVEALEAGIAAVRPGVRAADVARAENDVFRKYGLGEYTTSQ